MDNFSDLQRAEHIDRYLDGSLSAEGARAFEAALERDQALWQAYEDIRMSRTLVQQYALRNEIKSIREAMRHQSAREVMIEPMTGTVATVDTAPVDAAARPSDPVNTAPKVRPLFRQVLAYAGRIAAGVAILLIGFLGFQYATLSSDDLYAEKAMVYQVAASRSGQEPDASPEGRIEQQYRAQRFNEVMATYEQMNDPSLMATFLAGNAYLQEGKTNQAIVAFKEIATNGSQSINRFEEDAQYYLALSYLKTDRIADALPLLQEINTDPQHSYHSFVDDYYLWKVKFLNRM